MLGGSYPIRKFCSFDGVRTITGYYAYLHIPTIVNVASTYVVVIIYQVRYNGYIFMIIIYVLELRTGKREKLAGIRYTRRLGSLRYDSKDWPILVFLIFFT